VGHPRPEWSEHDPERLWQETANCLRQAAEGLPVAGLAISSFAEAGLPVDEDITPLYPIIAWYDRRTEPQARWWEGQFDPIDLHAITGQSLSQSFGVMKYQWFRENYPEKAGQMAYWLSTPDYIRWRLCGQLATDYSIASRTMCLDQSALHWSNTILEFAGLDPRQLPPAFPGGVLVGRITSQAAQQTGLPEGCACVLGGHDHLCGALAVGGFRPGVVVDSMGTAEATLVALSKFHSNPYLVERGYAVYAHVLPDLYVLKTGLTAAGAAMDWLSRLLNDSSNLHEAPAGGLEREAWKNVGRKAGPLWLPHLSGSGTPEGDRSSLAALIGVQIEHSRGDLFRGLLESLAFWLRHNLEHVVSITGQPAEEVILIGGTTRSGLLVQLKADILGIPMLLPGIPEESALGAALLAGIGARVFQGPEDAVSSLKYDRRVVEPEPSRIDWYDDLFRNIYLQLYPALKPLNHRLVERSYGPS
jgi:xylulokinase